MFQELTKVFHSKSVFQIETEYVKKHVNYLIALAEGFFSKDLVCTNAQIKQIVPEIYSMVFIHDIHQDILIVCPYDMRGITTKFFLIARSAHSTKHILFYMSSQQTSNCKNLKK